MPSLTTDLVMAAFAVGSAVALIWWHLWQTLIRTRRELSDEISKTRTELHAYQVAASEKYVHADHHTRSEERMFKALERIANEVQAMRRDFESFLQSTRRGD